MRNINGKKFDSRGGNPKGDIVRGNYFESYSGSIEGMTEVPFGRPVVILGNCFEVKNGIRYTDGNWNYQ